jgi:hypothetical protein
MMFIIMFGYNSIYIYNRGGSLLYRFTLFETSASALCGTTGID